MKNGVSTSWRCLQGVICCGGGKTSNFVRDRRHPLRLNWILPSSGISRSVGLFRSDVSGLYIGPIQETIEYGIDTWSRNVGSKPTYAAWYPRSGKYLNLTFSKQILLSRKWEMSTENFFLVFWWKNMDSALLCVWDRQTDRCREEGQQDSETVRLQVTKTVTKITWCA